jgi:hypothetical protein
LLLYSVGQTSKAGERERSSVARRHPYRGDGTGWSPIVGPTLRV